jgi:hypothetical protein
MFNAAPDRGSVLDRPQWSHEDPGFQKAQTR